MSYYRLKYGFITFEKAENAYSAIDSSSKDPSINHYDVSFGGRREFCRQTYADLGITEFLITVLS